MLVAFFVRNQDVERQVVERQKHNHTKLINKEQSQLLCPDFMGDLNTHKKT